MTPEMAATTNHSTMPAMEGRRCAAASVTAWTVWPTTGGPYCSMPCRMMPPPTQIIAAVPMVLSTAKEGRHAADERTSKQADCAANDRCAVIPRKGHADIVRLHDQGNHAVDSNCDENGDERQHERLRPDVARRDGRQRDRHDLRRQDEIRLDGARDLLVLDRPRIQRNRLELSFVVARMMRHHGSEHLLGTLVAEKGSAQHEQRRHRGGKEITQQQGNGQQYQQFIAQRPNSNLAHDRQFAFRGKADHVVRRDGCVIDDHASRLCSRLGRLARYIVERGCCHLCNRRDIVEKTNQSDTHQPCSFGLRAVGCATTRFCAARHFNEQAVNSLRRPILRAGPA
ncbi:hypothetical protein ACVW0I_004006 [Bradyrhizobium sp. LM6.11]